MSRFADRFATLIGAAPLHYQTRWRLLLANEMLKRPGTRVGDVARRIGYDSDAAFSRADVTPCLSFTASWKPTEEKGLEMKRSRFSEEQINGVDPSWRRPRRA